MANLTRVLGQRSSHTAAQERPVAGAQFDWLVVILSGWMIGGIHLDAWAHHQFEVETFFTPWHGVLYSGFLALAAVLVGTFARNVWRGYAWRQAMPTGYELSLVGVAIFILGGAGDMLWHIAFGIEVSIEALLSPTHLLLALGGVLLATGPLRAAWGRDAARPGWAVLVSLALLLSVLSFFTAYANPLSEAITAQGSRPAAEDEVFLTQGAGMAGILVSAGLMTGLVLLAVRRWSPPNGRLPFGSLAVVLGLSALLTVSVHEGFQLVPFTMLAGLVGDGLLRWWQPGAARPAAFRLFAFTLPVVFYALYFATLALTGGIWWSIHLWTGAIALAGTVGWLLSYAFVPPE